MSSNGYKIMSGKVSKTSGKRMSAKASLGRNLKNGEELRKNFFMDLKKQSYQSKPSKVRSPDKEAPRKDTAHHESHVNKQEIHIPNSCKVKEEQPHHIDKIE